MTKKHKALKNFIRYIFCDVGVNSPYELTDFLHILTTAALAPDFINNTSVKTQPGPNGQTVFNRLLNCTLEKIEFAFNHVLESLLKRVKAFLFVIENLF
jgi:hypothetical protein